MRLIILFIEISRIMTDRIGFITAYICQPGFNSQHSRGSCPLFWAISHFNSKFIGYFIRIFLLNWLTKSIVFYKRCWQHRSLIIWKFGKNLHTFYILCDVNWKHSVFLLLASEFVEGRAKGVTHWIVMLRFAAFFILLYLIIISI